MIKNYLLLAFRHIRKQKAYTIINVLGLSVGIACSIISILYVISELTYDQYHPDYRRIYRIISEREGTEGNVRQNRFAAPMSLRIKEDLPQAERVVRVVPPFENADHVLVVKDDTRFFEKRIFFADPEIFDIFMVPFISGNPETALRRPATAVITESMAEKYFGRLNVIGSTLEMEFDYDQGSLNVAPERFEITGVVPNPPDNTHLKYNMFVSMATMERAVPTFNSNWLNHHVKYCYVKLREGADGTQFTEALQRYTAIQLEQYQREYNRTLSGLVYLLQPISDIHMKSGTMDELEPPGSTTYIVIYTLIAGLVLLIGCMNYINLSTALSANRAREVGLRKVIGAGRGQLIWQFMSESTLITVISFLLALGLAQLLLPYFNTMAGTSLSLAILARPMIVIALAGLFAIVSVSAGIFPAFILTKFRPAAILQDRFKYRLKGSFMQKSLVIGQFGISIFLVVCTLVIFSQLTFMKGRSLGFAKEQKMILRVKSNYGHLRRDYDAIKLAFTRSPYISGAAVSSSVPGDDTRSGYYLWKRGMNREGMVRLRVITGCEDFIPLYGLQVLYGRAFHKGSEGDKTGAFIVNETGARELGFTEPKDAVGSFYTAHYHGETKKIVGVIKDFHFEGMQHIIAPLLIDIESSLLNTITLQVDTEHLPEVMRFVREQWNSHFPGVPFEFSFLDDDFDAVYRHEEQMGRWLEIVTALGILVACLGLSGLASFIAWKRQKEIGIRKVLGASRGDIVRLLSQQFVLLVTVSIALASPAAWLAMRYWLKNFAYRTPLHPSLFMIAGFAAVLLAFLSVSYQGFRSAGENPADSLRSE